MTRLALLVFTMIMLDTVHCLVYNWHAQRSANAVPPSAVAPAIPRFFVLFLCSFRQISGQHLDQGKIASFQILSNPSTASSTSKRPERNGSVPLIRYKRVEDPTQLGLSQKYHRAWPKYLFLTGPDSVEHFPSPYIWFPKLTQFLKSNTLLVLFAEYN